MGNVLSSNTSTGDSKEGASVPAGYDKEGASIPVGYDAAHVNHMDASRF